MLLGTEYADSILLRGLFFQAWGPLTNLKSQTRDPQLKVPPGGLVLRSFTSWKNPSTSAGFKPVNLGSRGEHVTARPPRPTMKQLTYLEARGMFVVAKKWIFCQILQITGQSLEAWKKFANYVVLKCRCLVIENAWKLWCRYRIVYHTIWRIVSRRSSSSRWWTQPRTRPWIM